MSETRYLGTVRQGEDEEIYYSITTTNWGSSPTDVGVVVKDEDGTDVSAGVTSGSASVAGDVITLPKIKSLTADTLYRVEISFTASGNVFEAFFLIQAET